MFKRRYRLETDDLITVEPDHHLPAPRRRILIPAVNRVANTIIGMAHNLPTAGHTGVDSTFRRVTERYHFKSAWRVVATYVRACRVCRTNRRPNHLPYGKPSPLQPPSAMPGAGLSSDFTFSLPPSPGPVLAGVTYTGIQVYVCRLTKRARLIPIVDDTITAEQTAAVYVQHYSSSLTSDA